MKYVWMTFFCVYGDGRSMYYVSIQLLVEKGQPKLLQLSDLLLTMKMSSSKRYLYSISNESTSSS